MPTASVQTDIFEPLARASAHQRGMPLQRFVFVPQPVMGKSPAELRAYIDGLDAVTGRPLMQEVIHALTNSLTDEEIKQVKFDRSTLRLMEPDTEDNLHLLFLNNNWTDKLPIVLSTEERVGARPAYFPVILALAATQATARASTTSSAASMAVVNGPVRHEIGRNCGIGALGPYNHANATLGRAYGLLSQNLQGGSIPGITYLGSQGNNYAYNSVTYAENEERSPWEPFHVQHGFKPGDSVVSVFGGCRSTAFNLGLREKHWREHVRNILRGLNPHNSPTFILDPITA